MICGDCLNFGTGKCPHAREDKFSLPLPNCWNPNEAPPEFGQGCIECNPLENPDVVYTWYCLQCMVYVQSPDRKCPICGKPTGRGTNKKELMV